MTIKKVQIIPPNYTDILHPETDSSVVLMGSGESLQVEFGDISTLTTTDKTNLVNAVNEIKELINDLDTDKVDNSRVLTDVPANAKFTDTVYTHPTTAGNKHIPTGGAANQYLKYSASGTAVWSDLGDAPSVDGKSIWVGAEGSKGTDANTIYFCY